jgi:hypothetical protein
MDTAEKRMMDAEDKEHAQWQMSSAAATPPDPAPDCASLPSTSIARPLRLGHVRERAMNDSTALTPSSLLDSYRMRDIPWTTALSVVGVVWYTGILFISLLGCVSA